MDSQDKQIKWKYVKSVHMHYDVNVDVVCRLGCIKKIKFQKLSCLGIRLVPLVDTLLM